MKKILFWFAIYEGIAALNQFTGYFPSIPSIGNFVESKTGGHVSVTSNANFTGGTYDALIAAGLWYFSR